MSGIRLQPAQRETLRQAIADAVFYRDPPLRCPDCETLPWLCSQCADGLAQARDYLALMRELEISPPAPRQPPSQPGQPGCLVVADGC